MSRKLLFSLSLFPSNSLIECNMSFIYDKCIVGRLQVLLFDPCNVYVLSTSELIKMRIKVSDENEFFDFSNSSNLTSNIV